ncbi:hypothetical protein [Methylocystis hirsuta]|uniref:Chromosome segregation protein SMC n=1 Tax=Methylocystis hirsuta TaxID=369798 RepID=A0A3M9XM87_9HYPH|nr:hypothetical protein [Methylocystis hirsuta]RNJ49399.1 hypothetical protein D1O30_07075 [Methylocystis hirsuta]
MCLYDELKELRAANILLARRAHVQSEQLAAVTNTYKLTLNRAETAESEAHKLRDTISAKDHVIDVTRDRTQTAEAEVKKVKEEYGSEHQRQERMKSILRDQLAAAIDRAKKAETLVDELRGNIACLRARAEDAERLAAARKKRLDYLAEVSDKMRVRSVKRGDALRATRRLARVALNSKEKGAKRIALAEIDLRATQVLELDAGALRFHGVRTYRYPAWAQARAAWDVTRDA